MPQLEEIKQKLSQYNEFTGINYTLINNFNCLEIPNEKIIDICKVLKNELGFDQLIDVVGVDRFEKNNRFEVIYNLWCSRNKFRLFIRVRLDSKKPEIETVSSVWSTANWLEREAYDMFGIIFLKHPDLRRIYMMEEFEYYPLRKDYPLMGIPGAVELPKK